jgi:CRP/FNR family transcriptional regulator
MSAELTEANAGQDLFCPHEKQHRASCSACRLNSICLPIALEDSDINRLDEIVQRSNPLQKGDSVCHEGQPFTSLFALRTGSLKAYRLAADGKEQITGFYLPGELFGVDGIAQNRHMTTVMALETSSICEIPFSSLEQLSTLIPGLQRHVFKLMSQEIAQDQQLITLLSKNSAEQRIAALLLNLSRRSARLKLSSTALRLPMSRTDIGNYLGLTVETVSRIFSRFQKAGILEVQKREIRICNTENLSKRAGI